jgi:hypothetical protein
MVRRSTRLHPNPSSIISNSPSTSPQLNSRSADSWEGAFSESSQEEIEIQSTGGSFALSPPLSREASPEAQQDEWDQAFLNSSEEGEGGLSETRTRSSGDRSMVERLSSASPSFHKLETESNE